MSPPVLRRKAQTPRPVRHNTSSANLMQELLLLFQHVVPLIPKSVFHTLRHVWKILYLHNKTYIYMYNGFDDGVRRYVTVINICQRQGALSSRFFLMCPLLLQSNMSEHYSHTCSTSLSFCMFSNSLQPFSMLLFYHLFNNCIYLCLPYLFFSVHFWFWFPHCFWKGKKMSYQLNGSILFILYDAIPALCKCRNTFLYVLLTNKWLNL